MSKVSSKKFIKVLPSLLLLAVIALLAGISFLPAVRNANTVAVTSGQEIDPEAMRVLGCCRAYAATNDFQTTMNGTIKAKVFGVPYTQKVHGGRSVDGDNFSDVAESVSTLVKAGIKRECADGKFTVARGEYKNKAFVYGKPTELDRDGYIAAYGMPYVGLVKYDIDNSIVKAVKKDENTFRFVLDASRATEYSRNEVRTTVGGKSYPDYESVEFTLTTDGDRVVKITAREKFRIDKFGGTHCTAEYTEVFKFD